MKHKIDFTGWALLAIVVCLTAVMILAIIEVRDLPMAVAIGAIALLLLLVQELRWRFANIQRQLDNLKSKDSSYL